MAKIVLSNAHCKKAQGATYGSDRTEWLYSKQVNAFAKKILENFGHNVHVVEEGGTAREDLNRTIRQINEMAPDCAVENHLNGSASPDASYGSEVICYPGSKDGRRLAACISDRFKYLPVAHRGVDERRNLAFLRATNCPAVITEPFFITHELENRLLDFERGIEVVGILIAEGILSWLENRGG